MTFLIRTLDWMQGHQSAHMGSDQYVAHNGTRDGQSMSGALLWAASETKTVSVSGNMVNAETKLLNLVAAEIVGFVPKGVAVIDLGPGTVTAFKNKTLQIINALNSKTCALVDDSMAFLQAIAETDSIDHDLELMPIVDDFFETENAYIDQDAIVCSFGSTISNFPGTLSENPPRDVLVNGLQKMANAAKNGWMLIAFDSDKDGERIKAFYRNQKEFQLNIFYRMAAELPIKGDFDPKAFEYEPAWIASSGQLAHLAVVRRDMNFSIGNTDLAPLLSGNFAEGIGQGIVRQ